MHFLHLLKLKLYFIKDNVVVLSFLVTALSFLSGGVFAYLGLAAWRAQMRGKDLYEIAKRLLKSLYRVRARVEYMRAVWISSGEIAAALEKHFPKLEYKPFDKSEDDQIKVDRAVVFERWSKVREALVEYEVIKFEALVHWGEGIETAFEAFEKTLNGLWIKAEMMTRLRSDDRDGSKAVFTKYVYYYGETEPDEFGDKFKVDINAIESIIRPAIE